MNKYYLIPLLIGIAGLIWQYKRDRNGFILVLTFFIMTGLAIILFLNQSPNQPRERDYAYAGSFYAFAIWIGLGFMHVYEQFRKYLGNRTSVVITLIVLAACPVLMATSNWDDHDRSDRYTARDIGANYLNSCDENAVLFTYGDNDSFPVWYVQDVEGIRSDVRVANLSYIQAGWYINMMRQKAFESDPLPLSLSQDKYIEGVRVQLPVNNRIDKPVDLKEVVKFAGMDDRKYMIDYTGQGDYMNYLPASKFIIDVDTSAVLANGTVKPYFRKNMVSPMIWEFSDENAFKGDLAIMDLLSNNDWKRPVYFSTTVPSTEYKGLQKFFIQEGMAYRVAPVTFEKASEGEFGKIDCRVMYDNMMNKFKWGNAADPSVYLDENNRRMFSNFRRIFGNLGIALLEDGDTTRAIEAVRRGMEIVPASKMPHDYFSIGLAEVLIRGGQKEEGEKLIGSIVNYSKEYLDYSIASGGNSVYGMDYPIGLNMQALLDIYKMGLRLEDEQLVQALEPSINSYYSKLYSEK